MGSVKFKAFIVIVLAILTFGANPAFAKARVDALTGLVPKGMVIQDAPTTLTAADISGAHIAIIPSQNFLNYMTFAQKWFNPKRWKNGFGDRPKDELVSFLMKASDPKVLTDRLVEDLIARGAKVSIASSLPDAKAQGATLFLVYDYYGKWASPFRLADLNPFASSRYYWNSDGGIQILNGQLARVLSIPATGQATYKDVGFFPGMDQQTLNLATAIFQSQNQYLDMLSVKISEIR